MDAAWNGRGAPSRSIVRTAGTTTAPLRRVRTERRRLALVPRPRSERHRRETEPARTVEPGDRRERAVEDADPGAGAFESDRVGRHGVRHERDQQPRRCDVQARTLRRRRRVRRSIGHRWMLYAIDKRTGKIRWERIAAQGEPRNKRHIKSTYASASPATDGRIVVAWFGSQGIYAYDMNGGLRWSVDLGRVDMGAYDIPAYEWGPASSPIIWNDLVIVQCDTQADSFLIALECRNRRDGLEDGSQGAAVVGHADDRHHRGGSGARHQRVEFRARLRSANRQGAVAARRQLEDHRADADLRQRPAHHCEWARARTPGVSR